MINLFKEFLQGAFNLVFLILLLKHVFLILVCIMMKVTLGFASIGSMRILPWCKYSINSSLWFHIVLIYWKKVINY